MLLFFFWSLRMRFPSWWIWSDPSSTRSRHARARGPFAQQSRPFSTVGKSHITTSTIQQLPPSSFSFRFVSFLSYVYVYKYILDIIIIHSYSGLYLYLIYGLNSSLRVLAYYCTLCSYSQSASTTSYTTVQRERQRESFVPCL